MKFSMKDLAAPSRWIDVDSMEEKPFDFLPHQKMRHKVSESETDNTFVV